MTKLHWPSLIEAVLAAIAFTAGLTMIVTGCIGRWRIGPDPTPRNQYGRRTNAQIRRDHAGKLIGRGVTAVVVTAVLAAMVLFPYRIEYHRYTHLSGILVRDATARMMTTGSAEERKVHQVYAISFADQTVRCDDTRCADLHTGDQVGLWCIKEWEWPGTNGWACKFDIAYLRIDTTGERS